MRAREGSHHIDILMVEDNPGDIRLTLEALKENKMKKTEVKQEHFGKALEKTMPSITEKTEKGYEEFKEHISDYSPSYVG